PYTAVGSGRETAERRIVALELRDPKYLRDPDVPLPVFHDIGDVIAQQPVLPCVDDAPSKILPAARGRIRGRHLRGSRSLARDPDRASRFLRDRRDAAFQVFADALDAPLSAGAGQSPHKPALASSVEHALPAVEQRVDVRCG